LVAFSILNALFVTQCFYVPNFCLYCHISGISLSPEQWSVFRKNVPAIEEAIIKMELKLR